MNFVSSEHSVLASQCMEVDGQLAEHLPLFLPLGHWWSSRLCQQALHVGLHIGLLISSPAIPTYEYRIELKKKLGHWFVPTWLTPKHTDSCRPSSAQLAGWDNSRLRLYIVTPKYRRHIFVVHSAQCESKKVAPPKLFAIFSFVMNLCNWKLPWLLPKHIPMLTPMLVHLPEYLYE